MQQPRPFSPADVARNAANGAGDLRIGLGCEAMRLGDPAELGALIAALLPHGPVKLTARADRPITISANAQVPIDALPLPASATAQCDRDLLRITLPWPEVERVVAPVSCAPDLRLSGRSFLVADDSHTNLLILAEMLKAAGGHVDVVSSGPCAVELAMTRGYDLLLLDISMPGMGGCEVLELIRARACTTPAFAVTANAMSHQVREYIDAGFAGHLAKPLQTDDLVQAISDFFA